MPYFFTRAGYEKAYLLGLATVAEDLKKDLWVLGSDADTAGLQSQIDQIRPGVADLYAQDYIAAWEEVASTLKPAAYFSDPAALGAFTKTPSPLKILLLELRKNTIFKGGPRRRRECSGRRWLHPGSDESPMRSVTWRARSIDAATEMTNHFRRSTTTSATARRPPRSTSSSPR